MKKTKLCKLLALALCATTCFAVGTALTACDDGGERIYFEKEEVKKGPQFLEGALADVIVNDTIVLSEYVQYVNGADYTLTIKDEEGNVEDLTEELVWYAVKSGDYVLTYEIKSGSKKGKSEFVLKVRYPELTWDFSLENLPYNFGDTLVFEDYFNKMNIYASLENWEVMMDSVTVDGQETDLSEATEYTFNSLADHTFKFHIQSEDGQRCEGREVISMKYVDEAYLNQLTDMGISIYGDLYVEDGNYTMVEGSYCNGNNVWLRRENGPHNLPYIAYNGDYGIGDYLKIDFTGKNMPLMSFFREDYSKSIFDGSKGIVVNGGFANNNGQPLHEKLSYGVSIYGPYMMHEYDRNPENMDTVTLGGAFSGSVESPAPGSFGSLQDGTRYRMMAGFTGVRKGRANKLGTTTPVDTLFLDFQCVIINLDTKEIFSKFTLSTYGVQAMGFEEIPVLTENNPFFTGNIVLYGQHGRRTTFDKIYPIVRSEGKSFDEVFAEELQVSEFKEGAKNFIIGDGTPIQVSDYVDTTKEGYVFFYKDEAGNTYNVDGESFTITQSGNYTLWYSDGKNLCTSFSIFVGNFSDAIMDWIKTDKLNIYGVDELTEDHGATLKAGSILSGATYNGPNAGNKVDQAYLALDGEYGLNDYLVLDFTGKNMPEVAFFAQNYNNSMYYQDGNKQGVVVMSGITEWNGELKQDLLNASKQVAIDSPFMVENAVDTWFVSKTVKDSKLGRANLEDGKAYRVIIGFAPYGTAGIQLEWALYDRTTGEKLEEQSITTWNFFNGGTHAKVQNMTYDDLVGSIVLYGKFGTTCTIDKIWSVYQDTNITDVAAALGM